MSKPKAAAAASDKGRNAYAGVVMGSESGTPVAAQRIWYEHIEKELRFQVVRTEYTRNPATVILLPEKPTDLKRALALRQDAQAEAERTQIIDELKAKDPRAHAEVIGRLERSDTSPRRKFAYPQTTAQEMGWDLDMAKIHQTEQADFAVPHTSGDISAFADKYVASNGHNQFGTSVFKYHPRTTGPKK